MGLEKQSYLRIDNKKEAYFTLLGATAITIFSLGVLSPISFWLLHRYIVPRKFINNRRLSFNAKLWVYCLIFYIGLVLIIGCVFLIEFILQTYHLKESIPHQFINAIPSLLVSLFINIWMNRYTQVNTHFVDVKDGKSGFKFHIWLFLGKYVLTKTLKIVSIGLLYPLSTRMSCLYDYKRCYIDGYHFKYHFSLKKMYPRWLLDLLFSVITIGFYLPIALLRRYSIDQQFVHILDETK